MSPASKAVTVAYRRFQSLPPATRARVSRRAFFVLCSGLLPLVPALGLARSLLVAVLACLNLAFGSCAGCQVSFLLGRSGVLRQA